LKTPSGLTIAAVVALTAFGTALAAPVLIVRTSDLSPYKLAEQAFTSSLGQEVRSLNVATDKAQLDAAVQSAAFVFAIGPGASRAVAEAKPSVPTVYALVPNPEKEGLSAADARSRVVPMFVPPARQLRSIRALLPHAKKLGILFDPSLSAAMVAECEEAAAQAGLSLVKSEVASKQQVAAASRALMGSVDAIWLIPDATVISAESFKFMVQTSLETKVPLIGFSQGMSKAGALLSIEAEYAEIGKKAAATARKALGGTVTAPDAPDGTLYLNSKSASLLNITIPAPLKNQAANVF